MLPILQFPLFFFFKLIKYSLVPPPSPLYRDPPFSMHVISNFLWDKFPSSLLFIIKYIVTLVPQVVMLPHQFLYFLSAYHFFQAVASSRLVFLPPSPEFQGAPSVFKAKQAAARLVDQVVGSTSPAPSFSRHLSVARLSFPNTYSGGRLQTNYFSPVQ